MEADGDRRQRVTGIVKDVRAGYGGTAEAAVYWPLTREGTRAMTVLARTSGDPGTLAAAMRTAALQLDPKVLVSRPEPVSLMLDRTIATARFETLLFTMFGVLALIVAVIGVYGLMAFWVGARLQEMGVRLALGASGWGLKSLVLRQASLPLFTGIVLGLFGAFALTRRLESLLYGITPRDPATSPQSCSYSPAQGFSPPMRQRAAPPGSTRSSRSGLSSCSQVCESVLGAGSDPI